MIRVELIERMAELEPHISCQLTDFYVRHLLTCLKDTLCEGGRIEIRGFGSFERQFYPPRIARNPKTGRTLKTKGKHALRFKCGKALREAINQARQQQIPIHLQAQEE